MGRMLPEFNCFLAKVMAEQRWVLTAFVEAREFLWWLEALVFACGQDALELVVQFDDIHFLSPCKQVVSGIA